jgi:phosphotransferase system enzyme I (PtsP)
MMMDVHARLTAVVLEAKSAADGLASAARVVAEALGAQTCTIFVRRKKNGVEVRADYGPARDHETLNTAKMLAEKALADVLPQRAEARLAAMVAVPVAAINHAIGAIVAQREAGAPFTAEEIMRLSGAASQIVGLIESARLIETIRRTDVPAGRTREASEPPPFVGERVFHGTAASPGIAIGAATFRNAFPRALVDRETTSGDSILEAARVRDALQKTRSDLVRMQSAAATEIGEEQALIFGAHLLLLNDPMLGNMVDQSIALGHPASISVDDAFDEIVRRLREARDPYLAERVEDMEDLRSRILGHLVGVDRQENIDARVVVSVRTTPSLVIELKARGALGVASELGGPTSHGALLARALGVPAVSGIADIVKEIAAGDLIIVDGDEGVVVIRPTAETRAEYARRSQAAERTRTEFLRYRDEPARTADGLRFQLQANIALGSDLEVARDSRADGVGLYRTEFPFIVRDALPTVEEQTRIYAKAYESFPTLPVTFRLLDLAGDKFLPSGELGVARDAIHGYRSIRILFDYPHVLRDQVQAFAKAAAGKDLRILIPMVTSLEDVVRIKHMVASSLAESPRACACTSVSYGAMVETPAAVEIVAELASEVDFFSVGTNDLVQYALVVDREDPRVTSERHAYHPAVLRMISRVVRHAHGMGKPVTVCGEMAARPELAIALLAFGVDGLSVTPRLIPAVKQALARVAVGPLRAEVGALLAIPTAEGVEVALRRYVRTGKLFVSWTS